MRMMEEVEKRVLSRLRPQLIKEMVVTESFLTAFCQADLLDDFLASGIRAESNFEKRATKLLETLPSQSSRAFFTLMEILEITNPWLSEKMKAALHDERTRDAKINIHPSVAKSAAIEGFGHSRLHIDPDIKERATKFVHTNLYHLTEAEQRGVEKWMADELQRERRRQQFRAPLESRRQREFHSTKETQTDTCSLDLREMFDELAVYLHGVDYDEQEDSLSFGLIHKEAKELLARTKNLDNLFLNCWNKFDETDKYSQSLPDLIDRLVHREKRLMSTEELDKQMISKLKDERENLKRRVRRLEDELESILKRLPSSMSPQEAQLRQRQSVHLRYTFPYPADSPMMEDGEDCRRLHADTTHNNNAVSDEIKPPLTASSISNATITGVSIDKNSGPQQSADKAPRNGTHPHTNPHSHHANGNPGVHVYRAEPVHFEEKTIPLTKSHQSEDRADSPSKYRINNKGKRGSFDGESERGITEKESCSNSNKTAQFNVKCDVNQGPTKLRRYASEESIPMAVSREEMTSTSTSSLNSDVQPRQLSVEDLPTAVSQQSKYPIPKAQNRVTRADLQTRVQRLIANRSGQNVRDNNKQSGRELGTSTTNSSTGYNSHNSTKTAGGRPYNNISSRDSSPSSTSGKNSLQTSYDVIHNTKTRDRSPATMPNKSLGSAKSQIAVQNPAYDHSKMNDSNIPDKQGLFLLANRYNGYSTQDSVKRQQVERYVQLGHPYRSFSSERVSRGPEKGQSPLRSNTNILSHTTAYDTHKHHGNEYSSDSELVLKPSSLKVERTTKSNKQRSRSVRFANPISRSTNPHKRQSRYQMDTTSTAQKKIYK